MRRKTGSSLLKTVCQQSSRGVGRSPKALRQFFETGFLPRMELLYTGARYFTKGNVTTSPERVWKMVNERTAELVQQKLKVLGLDAVVPSRPRQCVQFSCHTSATGARYYPAGAARGCRHFTCWEPALSEERGPGGQQQRGTSCDVSLHGQEFGHVSFMR